MLLLNVFVYFLPMAFADEALRDYQSMSELLAAATHKMPKDQEIVEIHFKKDVEDLPVLRPYTELSRERSTGRSRRADSFGKMFRESGYRSGYRCNVTARACCRWVLMETVKMDYQYTACIVTDS